MHNGMAPLKKILHAAYHDKHAFFAVRFSVVARNV